MVMNDSFEGQLIRLISEAKSELDKKGEVWQNLREEILTIEEEVKGYESTLRGFQKRTGRVDQVDIDWNILLTQARNHKEEIILVLKQLGGISKPNRITDILYSKGFIKSKKRANAYQIVYGNLAELVDRAIVLKLDTGEYKLIGSQSLLPNL